MTNALRDANHIAVGLANSSSGTQPLFIDPATGRLEIEIDADAASDAGSLTLTRALHDANHVPTIMGVSDADNITPMAAAIDSVTGYLIVDLIQE